MVFTLCNTITAIDIDSIYGIISIELHAFLVGVGIGCVIFTMIQLVVTWVSILSSKGKVRERDAKRGRSEKRK